jgi:proton-translocating NADH-quinone oxidoreductase chain M
MNNIKINKVLNIMDKIIIEIKILVFSFVCLFWYKEISVNIMVSGFSEMWDWLSLSLVWLTLIIFYFSVLYITNNAGFAKNNIYFFLTMTVLVCILSFISKNLFEFFIFFEIILIPMVAIIGLSSRTRKIHAAYYFFFYTFVSSLFVLLAILIIYKMTGNLVFDQLNFFYLLNNSECLLLYVLFFIGFASKIPVVPLHLWLPEAHVEAPTAGSVILAAILLKLGVYGMYRTMYPLGLFESLEEWKFVIYIILLSSLVISSLIGCRQIDIKKIIAYSSVSHMSYAIIGLFLQSDLAIYGMFLLNLSHGLISGGLFFCVGMLYDRFHTRNLFYYGGLVQYMPIFSLVFFSLIFCNISLPGTFNFVGEAIILFASFKILGIFGMILLCTGLVFVTVFSMVILLGIVFYQNKNFLLYNFIDLQKKETTLLISILILCVVFGLFPNIMINAING